MIPNNYKKYDRLRYGYKIAQVDDDWSEERIEKIKKYNDIVFSIIPGIAREGFHLYKFPENLHTPDRKTKIDKLSSILDDYVKF